MQMIELLAPITWVLLPHHTHRDLSKRYHVRRNREGWALTMRVGLTWIPITRRQQAPHPTMEPEQSEGTWWWTYTRPAPDLADNPELEVKKPEPELSFEDEITEKLLNRVLGRSDGWDSWPDLVRADARHSAPLPVLVADDDEELDCYDLPPLEIVVIEAGPAQELEQHHMPARVLLPAKRPGPSAGLLLVAVLGGLVLLGVLESSWWLVEQIARVP